MPIIKNWNTVVSAAALVVASFSLLASVGQLFIAEKSMNRSLEASVLQMRITECTNIMTDINAWINKGAILEIDRSIYNNSKLESDRLEKEKEKILETLEKQINISDLSIRYKEYSESGSKLFQTTLSRRHVYDRETDKVLIELERLITSGNADSKFPLELVDDIRGRFFKRCASFSHELEKIFDIGRNR